MRRMPSSTTPFSASTSAALDRQALDKQVADRIPGVAAAVARDGVLRWWTGVGSADLAEPDRSPDADTQFEVASNTKTFVAATIMRLRDEGRLSLDDTVDRHVPGAGHSGATIRQLLSHTSGMQREPVGDVWDTLEFPDVEGLVSGWNEAERVLPPRVRWHYSNLCYAMLGRVIAELDGGDWFASVRRRFLEPLGMRRTTLGLSGRRAVGYFVPPWTDVPVVEPSIAPSAMSPAGGICSTLTDMATWHGFLAAPDAEILSPDSVEEMVQPQTMADPAGWTQAYGLGLQLIRRDDRTWVGHTGGHPGFITGFFTDRDSATTGLFMANQSATTNPGGLATALGSYAVEHEPVLPSPWRPGTEVPEELRPLLGRWFSEGQPFVFSVREGRLEARVDLPSVTEPSRFELVSPDVYRTVAGRERGELLRIRRDADGRVTAFNWATYLFTREPYAFGEWLRARD